MSGLSHLMLLNPMGSNGKTMTNLIELDVVLRIHSIHEHFDVITIMVDP